MPEFQAQQQQQMAAGFKHIQASHKTSARVVPEGLPMSPTSNVKKRCGWITSQSGEFFSFWILIIRFGILMIYLLISILPTIEKDEHVIFLYAMVKGCIPPLCSVLTL
jgi:hypothetical protein